MATSAAQLDFSALLSRNHNHRPARAAQIVPREALKPVDPSKDGHKKKKKRHSDDKAHDRVEGTGTTTEGTKVVFAVDEVGHLSLVSPDRFEGDEDENAIFDAAGSDTLYVMDAPPQEELDMLLGRSRRHLIRGDVEEAGESGEEEAEEEEAAAQAEAVEEQQEYEVAREAELESERRNVQRRREREAEEMAYALSALTAQYATHVEVGGGEEDLKDRKRREEERIKKIRHELRADDGEVLERRVALERRRVRQEQSLPCKMHEVEIGDWEDSIDWDGAGSRASPMVPAPRASVGVPPSKLARTPSCAPVVPVDPAALLFQPTNPSLEALDFSASVSWDGAAAPKGHNQKLASKITLLLHETVAGRSVALSTAPSRRPESFGRSAIFARRYERELNSTSAVSSTASAGVANSLNPDADKMEAIIKARQKKRAMMAKDKSHRVTEAMGTLALGGGKGRTITSSLMGPGGTERTGRPSRHSGSSSAHDAEYVEQLELVFNHTLVKPDLRKTELRQFHRPRLPRSTVRPNRPWQFQMRAFRTNSNKSQKASDGSTVVGSWGTHHGASSHGKIRNEADLSPSEGNLIVFEYCEERPPVQLSKGMACRIVNYYRGDKSRCPISAGGGDRPTRKKRTGDKAAAAGAPSGKAEKPPRLRGPNLTDGTSPTDLIGVKKKKGAAAAAADAKLAAEKKEKDKPAVDILPEGVTEILHPKVHGPFIGEVEEGTTQSGLITNLFAAPVFRHDAEPSDFLMILGRKPSHKHRDGGGSFAALGVVLRPLPLNVFCVGQTEPRVKVFAPNTTGEKNFTAPFVTYQIAKALQRTETKEGRGLRFDEINDRLFANTVLLPNALRQRIKQVASYDKNTQIWTTKPVGFEDYPGVEPLGRRFSPEGVAAYEAACAAVRRLCDLGIHDLHSGSSSVTSVGASMVYLNGQVAAARERKSKISKMVEYAKTAKSNTKARQIALYEMAASKLEGEWREIKRIQEVARFIYEELQLAPWHLTSEFIDVHKHAQGTAMMRLTGLGDPSGQGEAYNFLREVDAKPNKGTGNSDGALNAQIKKITGTENDLRKLTMKQMASLLRSYGMNQKDIDKLRRWDRVHVIRDLSTKAASDGMGDGLERYARGEKMKLSDQKQMYRERIQEIWRRQRAALSTDASELIARGPGQASSGAASAKADGGDADAAIQKQLEQDMDDSDSDSDDDDLADTFMEDMMDVKETNQLVAAQVRGDGGDGGAVGGLGRRIGEDQEMSKDARELAALKRQREEERAAQEGLLGKSGTPGGAQPGMDGPKASTKGRKVVRRRVTKTHPDGTQTTTFKFIVLPEEVEKAIAKKKKQDKEAARAGKEDGRGSKKKGHKGSKHGKKDHEKHDDRRTVGHSMFEDDDDFHDQARARPNIKLQLQKTTRVITTKTKKSGKGAGPPKAPPKMAKRPKLQLGKLKQKVSQEKRNKKRRREAEEADLYMTAPQRKGTSNRRERGSARDRMPHVIMADRLESIRTLVEKRPGSGPFHRPVNRRALPRYYEVISEPIDLQTIRDKNQRYEYRKADLFVRDFDLMKNNAIKFNGVGSILGNEATAMYEFVKNTIEQNRSDFDSMEEAVREQMSGGRKRAKTSSAKNSPKSSPKSSSTGGATSAGNGNGNSSGTGATANVVLDGVATTVNLGNLPTDFGFGGGDSDSDDSAGVESAVKSFGLV